MKLDETLFRRAREASETSREARDQAIEETARTVRLLLEALREALQGEPLRGLPNIGTSRHPFYAGRVRGARRDGRLERPDRSTHPNLTIYTHGPRALCLDWTGKLVMAAIVDREGKIDGIDVDLATEEDLLIGDAESLAQTIAWALERHAERSEATARNSGAAADLARRITDALGR